MYSVDLSSYTWLIFILKQKTQMSQLVMMLVLLNKHCYSLVTCCRRGSQ